MNIDCLLENGKQLVNDMIKILLYQREGDLDNMVLSIRKFVEDFNHLLKCKTETISVEK